MNAEVDDMGMVSEFVPNGKRVFESLVANTAQTVPFDKGPSERQTR